MDNREKAIRALECCTQEDCYGLDCPYVLAEGLCFQQMSDDALKVIREMAEELEELKKERPKVILCKHCKHQSKSLSPYQEFGVWCKKHDRYVNSDFYCADGKEMKEDDDHRQAEKNDRRGRR